MNNLGNNVYHIGGVLPPLLNILDFYNSSDDIEDEDVFDKYVLSLYDFFNSYNYDKILLLDLINKSIDKASDDLLDSLIILKQFYIFYNTYSINKKFNKIEVYNEISQPNILTEDGLLQTHAFDIYNKFDYNIKDIEDLVKKIEDETEKKLYEYFLEYNDRSEIMFYYIYKETIIFDDILKPYFNEKYTLYDLMLDKLDKSYINEHIKLLLNLDNINNQLLNLSSILTETLYNLEKYDSPLYNRLDMYNDFILKVKEIRELVENIVYFDEQNLHIYELFFTNNNISNLKDDIINLSDKLEDDSDTVKKINDSLEYEINAEKEKEIIDTMIKTLDDSSELYSTSNKLILKMNKYEVSFIKMDKREKLTTYSYNEYILNCNLTFRDKFKNKINDFQDKILNMFDDIIPSIDVSKNLVADLSAISDTINKIIGSVYNIIDKITKPLQKIIDAVNKAACMLKSIVCFIQSLLKSIENMIETFKNMLNFLHIKSNLSDFITEFLTDRKKEINLEEMYKNSVYGYQDSLIRLVSLDVKDKLDEDHQKDFIEAANNKFTDCYDDKEDDINDNIKDMVDDDVNDINNDVEDIINNDVIAPIASFLTSGNCPAFLPVKDGNKINLEFNLGVKSNPIKIPKNESKKICE